MRRKLPEVSRAVFWRPRHHPTPIYPQRSRAGRQRGTGRKGGWLSLSLRSAPAAAGTDPGTWRAAWGTQRNSGSCCAGWCDSPHLTLCFQRPGWKKQQKALSISEQWDLQGQWRHGKEAVCQCRRRKRRGFDPWVWNILCRKKWQTHSNILAWEIPWTEEPGRLQSMGSQRVRPDRAHTGRGGNFIYMAPPDGLTLKQTTQNPGRLADPTFLAWYVWRVIFSWEAKRRNACKDHRRQDLWKSFCLDVVPPTPNLGF